MARLGGLVVAYWLTAQVAGPLNGVSTHVTGVWPPVGLAFAAVLFWGPASALGIWPAALLASAHAGTPWLAAAAIATGNTLEALAGGLGLRALGARGLGLERTRGVLALLALAPTAAAIGAAIGTQTLLTTGLAQVGSAPSVFRAWWLADTLGAVIVCPLVVVLADAAQRRVRGRRVAEAALLGVSSIGGTLVALMVTGRPYQVFPVLVWGALRFGRAGAAVASAVAATLTVSLTAHGRGPFTASGPQHGPFEAQIFVAVAAVTALVLAALSAERERVLAELARQHAEARTDALTGIPNRRAFEEELRLEIQRAAEGDHRLALALIDLDDLKGYNDHHGHQGGDRLLRESTRAWRQTIGEDATLARLAGDEFAILLGELDDADALALCCALPTVVPFGRSCSVGLARWYPGDDSTALIARADSALYEAKRAGRACARFAAPRDGAPHPSRRGGRRGGRGPLRRDQRAHRRGPARNRV